MNRLPYDKILKARARELRKNGILGEVLLWLQLKNKQLCGVDFHRQIPIDHYIVDFFAPALLLAIEIDGCSHEEKQAYDQKRDARLAQLGVKVLRVREKDVRNHMEAVLSFLKENIDNPRHTTDPLPRRGGT